MGHRNTQFSHHMIDMKPDQQGHLHPEPCIFYRNISSFPQPSIHPPVAPATGNHCNYDFHFHSMYEMPQQNSVEPHHPGPNLDLAIASPGGLYNNNNPYITPTIQPAHSLVCVEGTFKRKNAEEVRGNLQHHSSLAGHSSSIAPSSESEPTSMLQEGLIAPPVGLPWWGMNFRASNGDFEAFRWVQAPLPYVHAHDISANNRSLGGFPPHIFLCHRNLHHPLPAVQGRRGYNSLLPSQVSITPPQLIPTVNPSSTSYARFQEVLDVRPAFVTPLPPMGYHLYRSQQRELMLDSTAGLHTLPHLRVLPEDEVAILEMPGYYEAGDSIDHHRDMRLDIDHMSYEELLALGEQIGSVGTGFPKGFVRKNLKTRTFTSSSACLNVGEEAFPDHKRNFCVICQTEYKPGERIGIVDCGHEYHKNCINKWLLVKNTCPICKSTAIGHKAISL